MIFDDCSIKLVVSSTEAYDKYGAHTYYLTSNMKMYSACFSETSALHALSTRCQYPTTGFALKLKHCEVFTSAAVPVWCIRDRPALYDVSTKCLGAGGRNGETLKSGGTFSAQI